MKKEIKNSVITLFGMMAVTILFLGVLSWCAFRLKWQSDRAMEGITLTYILIGLVGGWIRGFLERKTSRTIGIARAFLYGIILTSLYWGIPGGALMLLLKERITNIRAFAICFGMMALSITAGLLLCRKRIIRQ